MRDYGNSTSNVLTDQNQLVVLVHGLASHRLGMATLNAHLARSGFATVNWGYISVFDSIPRHAARFEQLLRELHAAGDEIETIHLVTHSMGGIIVRTALEKFRPAKLGRFVMLTPPNRGSHVARIVSRITGPTWPAMRQLSDAPTSFVNCLSDDTGCEVGVVVSVPDHVVKESSTRLASVSAYTSVKGPHRVVPFRHETHRKVTAFLRTGAFENTSV